MATTPTAPALIADDDAATLLVLTALLERLGFDVLTARDGHEAMFALRKHSPSLVLSDMQMPRVLGEVLSCTPSGGGWNARIRRG